MKKTLILLALSVFLLFTSAVVAYGGETSTDEKVVQCSPGGVSIVAEHEVRNELMPVQFVSAPVADTPANRFCSLEGDATIYVCMNDVQDKMIENLNTHTPIRTWTRVMWSNSVRPGSLYDDYNNY